MLEPRLELFDFTWSVSVLHFCFYTITFDDLKSRTIHMQTFFRSSDVQKYKKRV